MDPNFHMAPGEVDWLLDYHPRSDVETQRLVNFVNHRVTIRVSYCSLTNECAIECYPTGCKSKGNPPGNAH